ncbi:putative disease resistance protein RGA3 [Capsicum baccatum]|uniref:Disease resistance protein RGA3 n=1 Tax=Capsicum baccatum TaxID=33114 RepID=A0A2G2UVK7_CAPBA|nr:putative disease resistance protein RGA3 [Capsicum baccatum]
MGGLGKTTLAKAAYNDKMVTDHFELKAWTCVSEPYDVLRISKELLQEIDSFDSKYDNNLNRLQVKLKEKLNGKRFLIVLDDMWNENFEKWDELRSLFVQGAAGNYQFCKEQVIHLWIANGLVQPLHSGRQYFDELRSRSLFERAPESSERDGGKFLMHDLVNDLAQTASSKLCVRLEECQGSHMLEQCQHMSYSMGRGGDFEKLKLLSKSEQLRTLLPINIQGLRRPTLSMRVLHNILPRLTSLRALSLSGYRKLELPNDLFIKLKLLRFLDLSRTKIRKLPDSICALYNLETLLLSPCKYLEELPLHMEKLINLRHLDISNSFHLKMPLHLSKLKSLQVLVGVEFVLEGKLRRRR